MRGRSRSAPRAAVTAWRIESFGKRMADMPPHKYRSIDALLTLHDVYARREAEVNNLGAMAAREIEGNLDRPESDFTVRYYFQRGRVVYSSATGAYRIEKQ